MKGLGFYNTANFAIGKISFLHQSPNKWFRTLDLLWKGWECLFEILNLMLFEIEPRVQLFFIYDQSLERCF